MDVAEFFGLSFYYAYATATVAAAWAAADAVADATMTVAITAVKVLSSWFLSYPAAVVMEILSSRFFVVNDAPLHDFTEIGSRKSLFPICENRFDE